MPKTADIEARVSLLFQDWQRDGRLPSGCETQLPEASAEQAINAIARTVVPPGWRYLVVETIRGPEGIVVTESEPGLGKD